MTTDDVVEAFAGGTAVEWDSLSRLLNYLKLRKYKAACKNCGSRAVDQAGEGEGGREE